MAKAKKIILLHERRETWRIRFVKKHRAFCEQCQEETLWLTGAQAALVSDLSEREIFRLTENARLHFAESNSGLLMVCRHSLEAVSPMNQTFKEIDY